MTDAPRRVVLEADGGSRGNPGPAAYGALLRDPETGRVLVETAVAIGEATNNVAEYAGLLAGLRLLPDHAPDASLEVRMDSKLVVEQMKGEWKVKHPGLQPLHREAVGLAPADTVWTWVPRADNAAADALANEALDGVREGVFVPDESAVGSAVEEVQSPAPSRGWAPPSQDATTVVLVRHGVTVHTAAKRFSGGLGGDNPPLSDDGRAQARSAAEWLSALGDRVDAVVSSPVRRTRETAQVLADLLGHEVEEEPGFAEMEFGAWDGLTFPEVAERDGAALEAWLSSLDVPPPGGESFVMVQERVLAGLDRLLAAHRGRTVVVVSHVTPIKTLVAHAMQAPLDAVFRMELSPGSVSVVSFHPEREGAGLRGSLRLYNCLPPDRQASLDPGRW